MLELQERPLAPQLPAAPFRLPVETDDRAARKTLLEQISYLERDLAAAFIAAFPRTGFDWKVGSRAGPRLLSLGELEALRDALAERVHEVRTELRLRAGEEAEKRRLVEEMYADPRRYKWVRVTREECGERGCGAWHVRPRLGPVGMLMGWWEVKVSGGCPLPGRLAAAPQDIASRNVGRRSRKRALVDAPIEPQPAPEPQRDRRPTEAERPAAPWGKFPLVELSVLTALVLGVVGMITWGRRGQIMLACAAALGSLAGLELSIREHFAGYKSHSTVLAGTLAIATLAALYFASAPRLAQGAAALLVFGGAFYLLRELFKRRSGGFGFRA